MKLSGEPARVEDLAALLLSCGDDPRRFARAGGAQYGEVVCVAWGPESASEIFRPGFIMRRLRGGSGGRSSWACPRAGGGTPVPRQAAGHSRAQAPPATACSHRGNSRTGRAPRVPSRPGMACAQPKNRIGKAPPCRRAPYPVRQARVRFSAVVEVFGAVLRLPPQHSAGRNPPGRHLQYRSVEPKKFCPARENPA